MFHLVVLAHLRFEVPFKPQFGACGRNQSPYNQTNLFNICSLPEKKNKYIVQGCLEMIILRIRQMLLWRGSVCLTQPGQLNWGLEELPESTVSKLQLKRLDEGTRGVCNTHSALDPHFTTYSESGIVPVTLTPTLALSWVTKIVCRSLEYVFDSSTIFSV